FAAVDRALPQTPRAEWRLSGGGRRSMTDLLTEIEAFLVETDMPAFRFGAKAANNTALVFRMRQGGGVKPETAARIRAYMAAERANPTPFTRRKAAKLACDCGAPVTRKAAKCRSCASKAMA